MTSNLEKMIADITVPMKFKNIKFKDKAYPKPKLRYNRRPVLDLNYLCGEQRVSMGGVTLSVDGWLALHEAEMNNE